MMSMTTNRREKAATTFCMMDIFLSISVQVFLCSLFAQQRAQNDNRDAVTITMSICMATKGA